jgi:hypothetical protein
LLSTKGAFMTEKTARVHWDGAGKAGTGKISTETGALKDYPYGFASRFGDDRKGSNPVGADRKLTHLERLCRPKTDPGVLLALPIFWAGNKQGDHHGNVGKNSTHASTRQGVAA